MFFPSLISLFQYDARESSQNPNPAFCLIPYDTLFPHGSTMPAGAGQPPVIGEIVMGVCLSDDENLSSLARTESRR